MSSVIPYRIRSRRLAQVVMSISRAFYYLGLPSQHHKIVHPLLRLLAVSPEIERVVLAYVLSISHTSPVRRFLRVIIILWLLSGGSTCSLHIIPVSLFEQMTAHKSRTQRRASCGISSPLTITKHCCGSLWSVPGSLPLGTAF